MPISDRHPTSVASRNHSWYHSPSSALLPTQQRIPLKFLRGTVAVAAALNTPSRTGLGTELRRQGSRSIAAQLRLKSVFKGWLSFVRGDLFPHDLPLSTLGHRATGSARGQRSPFGRNRSRIGQGSSARTLGATPQTGR